MNQLLTDALTKAREGLAKAENMGSSPSEPPRGAAVVDAGVEQDLWRCENGVAQVVWRWGGGSGCGLHGCLSSLGECDRHCCRCAAIGEDCKWGVVLPSVLGVAGCLETVKARIEGAKSELASYDERRNPPPQS